MLRALLTDVDGTITDERRWISTHAIEAMRRLINRGVVIVLASGNTACFMDSIGRMIGTSGAFIAENGGVFRTVYGGSLHIEGDQSVCREAIAALEKHYRKKGIQLEMYSPDYRYADLAFARTVPVSEVRDLLKNHPVQVLDTSFAIHLQSEGINKATAFAHLARELSIPQSEFLAIGDAQNDIELLQAAGIGVAVANAHPDARAAADWVSKKQFGEGFTEALQYYDSYFLD